jgi:glutathione S-transferase
VEAPKGKLPYIEDGDEVIDDSTFIRDHIESRHGIDLDRSLSREQRALAWALERMMEDHLYWAILHLRWTDDANFAKGPAHLFDMLPEDIREATRRSRRARVQSSLENHGLGRHSVPEITSLAARSLRSVSDLLADNPYLMGNAPCGADASVFVMIASALVPLFD